MVELQPSKLIVASSSLVSRSKFIFWTLQGLRSEQSEYSPIAHVAQTVERFLGKEEVLRFDSGRGLHLFVYGKRQQVDPVQKKHLIAAIEIQSLYSMTL